MLVRVGPDPTRYGVPTPLPTPTCNSQAYYTRCSPFSTARHENLNALLLAAESVADRTVFWTELRRSRDPSTAIRMLGVPRSRHPLVIVHVGQGVRLVGKEPPEGEESLGHRACPPDTTMFGRAVEIRSPDAQG